MENLSKKFSINVFKSDIFKNLKSSTRFGETSIFSKNLSVFQKILDSFSKKEDFFILQKKAL